MFTFLNKNEIKEYFLNADKKAFIDKENNLISFDEFKNIIKDNDLELFESIKSFINKKEYNKLEKYIEEKEIKIFKFYNKIFITTKHKHKEDTIWCILIENMKDKIIDFVDSFNGYLNKIYINKNRIFYDIEYGLDETDVKTIKNNFYIGDTLVALWTFYKKRNEFIKDKYIDENVDKIILKNDKPEYLHHKNIEVDFSILCDMYIKFYDEDDSHDLAGLTEKSGNNSRINDWLMDVITNKTGKECINNLFVYLDKNGKILAFSHGYLYEDIKRGNISTLYVDPKYRGKGISTKLWKANEIFFRDNKCEKERISTLPLNKHAFEIYTKKFKFNNDIKVLMIYTK